MPFFSVIIPLYNKESHIISTVNSVLNQTFTDYEIIVVNDGSTDNGLNKVLSLKHEKIIVFNNKNNGVSKARNFAMEKANGDYFAFLDADDFWKKNHLSNLFKLITDFPKCGLYSTNYAFDYGDNYLVKTQFPTLPKSKNWRGIVPNYFINSLVNRIAWTSAVVIPKQIFNAIGGFDINFSSGQDTDYWTRIALNYNVAFTKEVSVLYNLKAENRISNIAPSNRSFMTFEKFKDEEKTNPSLKIYNDMYRAELAIKHKIVNNTTTYKYYKSEIDYNNINWKKNLLIKLPSFILKPLWVLKQWLKTKKIEIYS